MTPGPFNLAVETSTRAGSVTLGRDDEPLETIELAPQQRHNVDLMPTIDRLCQRHAAVPADLGELYLSIGPGSFTGLRIAVTTAKMLAAVLGTRVVAVPTLDVVAQNVPPPRGEAATRPRLAVCLALKRDRVYAGRFRHDGGGWVADDEPALLNMADLVERWPPPLLVLGDPLPPVPERFAAAGPISLLPPDLAAPRSEAVWTLGRAAAERGGYVDPLKLLPLYVRPPEAVELWAKRRQETAERRQETGDRTREKGEPSSATRQ